MERLRPEIKPVNISDEEWENSKCDSSPTGSHWSVSAGSNVFRCRFCGKVHRVSYKIEARVTVQKSKKVESLKNETLSKPGRRTGRPSKYAK